MSPTMLPGSEEVANGLSTLNLDVPRCSQSVQGQSGLAQRMGSPGPGRGAIPEPVRGNGPLWSFS